ncbi:MAG TPA: hypothetical protein VKD90_02715, partial [Gemmataceae bacterium]|nr:hypothetical protein [Gemmataceae bacterium]
MRRALPTALVLALLTPAVLAGDPADEKKWLDEKTWPAFVAPRRLDVKEKDDAVAKLLKERFNAGQQELGERYILWLQGIGTLDQVYETARRVVSARLEVVDLPGDRVRVLKEKVEFAKVVEKQAAALQEKHRRALNGADVPCAKYFRLDAEVELRRAERAAKQRLDK